MKNTEVIILAAGKGTRMGIDKPKCLLPIQGISMIERLLKNIEGNLLNKALIVVGYKAGLIKEKLGDTVRYVNQEEQKGTGHATMMALKEILPETKKVVILYSDHPFVSSETVSKLISDISNDPVAIAITNAEDFSDWKSNFKHFGRIIHNKDGGVDQIVEYKDANEEIRKIPYVNCGYYAFDVLWLKEALVKVTPKNAQGEYYLTDVIKIARDEGKKVRSIIVDPFEGLGLNDMKDVANAETLLDSLFSPKK